MGIIQKTYLCRQYKSLKMGNKIHFRDGVFQTTSPTQQTQIESHEWFNSTIFMTQVESLDGSPLDPLPMEYLEPPPEIPPQPEDMYDERDQVKELIEKFEAQKEEQEKAEMKAKAAADSSEPGPIAAAPEPVPSKSSIDRGSKAFLVKLAKRWARKYPPLHEINEGWTRARILERLREFFAPHWK